ncbi:MAG: hypothetical protein SCAL_001627 [Candidatus Syntrophoarchaeum caldarius]|uniref:Uncharacterized protein n=1 Tax=Candidatus Syntropharchaeum caldarium TaxID=1838285 RepID=A0A1F2P7Y8_9EURY|nr:MAG: hypothetical protein SCAL_001627 [Candidatus Syntrophoarchaeum caldarius]
MLKSLKSSYNDNEFEKILEVVEECLQKDKDSNFITDKEKSDVVYDLAFLVNK